MAADSGSWATLSKLLRDRIVYLAGEIDDDSAQVVIAQMLYLESQDRRRAITLYVNSPGGRVAAAFAIADAMRDLDPPVHTVAMRVAGVAVMIAAHGERGRRTALAGSRFGLVPLVGPATADAAELARTRDHVHAMLAADTGQTAVTIARDCERRLTLDAAGAKAYGLVDEIAARDAGDQRPA